MTVEQKTDRLAAFHNRHPRVLPILSFVGGFAYDTYTLERIDRWVDDLQMMAYLFLAGGALIIIGLQEYNRLKSAFLVKRLEWIYFGLHFCLGGLLSAYTIFYFKSATVSQSFIFLVLLVVIWLLNEFSPQQIARIKILSLVHFFCSCAFFTFFIPIVTHRMDVSAFLYGGLFSFLFTLLIWLIILRADLFKNRAQSAGVLGPPAVLFLFLWLLYSFNWIPPVPMSLKHIGIYRSVKHTDDGQYELRYRKTKSFEVGRTDDRTFEYVYGDTVVCFASIFAPAEMKQKIIHQWQVRDKNGDWQTTDRIDYPIVGGRDGGWRGYTMKRRVYPGKWRVDVVTEDEKVLGRINLSIVQAKNKPETYTYVRY